jgi:hypothetical protein
VLNHPDAYFNSTAAYAVAYAIHMGVKKISVFGMDFTYPNAHDAEKGRACVEFWLGIAPRAASSSQCPKHHEPHGRLPRTGRALLRLRLRRPRVHSAGDRRGRDLRRAKTFRPRRRSRTATTIRSIPTGEKTLTVTWAETAGGSGIWRFSIAADQVFTASGGAFGPFRYVYIYDDTPAGTPTDPLVGYIDYGSAITVNDTETFTVDVDANFALFTLT